MEQIKLISWNVNGIRSVLKKGFLEFLNKMKPDVLCLQETKSPGQDVEFSAPGYHQYWNHAQKKGYSGTLVLTKIKPLKVVLDMGIEEHDNEGRVITCEYENFFLVNVYVPNSKRGLERLPYRQLWDADFLKHLKKLERKKPVIICGDMNVAHKEIDLTYPKANIRNHGFTKEEREGFDNLINAGFIDTFREFNQEGGHYTWWSPMSNCRKRNIGWRIDYFCLSKSLGERLKSGFIMPDILGSDHCPVAIEISL